MRREPNMRPQVLFVVVATLAVFAALPLAQSKGQAKKASATPWPCCDNCSMCTRSLPPQCRCADTAPRGCHPACKQCEKSSRRGGDGALVYKCKDVITDYCKQRCTPAA